MSNIAINNRNFISRLTLPKNLIITDKEKKDALDKIKNIDSHSFFEELNSLLCSKDRVPAKNNETQKNLATILTNRGYDKGVTASASEAIIYHLDNISELLGQDSPKFYSESLIDIPILKCYLNLFMNLSDNDIQQILEYAKKPNTCQYLKNKCHLKRDIISLQQGVCLTKIILNNSNTQALINADKKESTTYKSILQEMMKTSKLNYTYIQDDHRNITDILDGVNEVRLLKGKLDFLQQFIGAHNNNEQIKKTQKDLLIKAKNKVKQAENNLKQAKESPCGTENITKKSRIEGKIYAYNQTLQMAKNTVQSTKICASKTYQRVFEKLRERIKDLMEAKPSNIIAYLPNGNKLVENKQSLPSAFNKLTKEEQGQIIADIKNEYLEIQKEIYRKKFLNTPNNSDRYTNLRHLIRSMNSEEINSLKNRINEESYPTKELEETVNAKKEDLLQLLDNIHSNNTNALNKVNKDFEYIGLTLATYAYAIYINRIKLQIKPIINWPINTYQLINHTGTILQTFTGALIDKNIDTEIHGKRLKSVIDSAMTTTTSTIAPEVIKTLSISRLLDSSSEKNKLEKDKKETMSISKSDSSQDANKFTLLHRQAHFSEGFWNNQSGNSSGHLTEELIKEYKSVMNRVIFDKFLPNRNIKVDIDHDTSAYSHMNLIKIVKKFYELQQEKQMSAAELTLYNTLHLILKNKFPEFPNISIIGCKSAKDRTAVEIATECALQTMIESSLSSDEFIDLTKLIKNNKFNIKYLTPELVKIFIDNFDDKIFYVVNKHDNNLYTNQNAKTHLEMLSDFSYHNKFKKPYAKITAGS